MFRFFIIMITVFIIIIVLIIIIIQGKDDTKLNKEINGWSHSAESWTVLSIFLKVSFTGKVEQSFSLTVTL